MFNILRLLRKLANLFDKREPYAMPQEYLTMGGFLRSIDITVTTWHAAQAKDRRRAQVYYAQNGCQRLRPGRQTRRYNKKARRGHVAVDSPFTRLESINVDS